MSEKIETIVECVLVAFAIIALSVVQCSCRTQVQIVERVHTDSMYLTNWRTDSIYIHDSIMVMGKGDTVYRDRWHMEYRYKEAHDTIQVTHTDSIPYPIEVVREEKYVPPFYKWSTGILWALVAILLVWGGISIYKRIKSF